MRSTLRAHPGASASNIRSRVPVASWSPVLQHALLSIRPRGEVRPLMNAAPSLPSSSAAAQAAASSSPASGGHAGNRMPHAAAPQRPSQSATVAALAQQAQAYAQQRGWTERLASLYHSDPHAHPSGSSVSDDDARQTTPDPQVSKHTPRSPQHATKSTKSAAQKQLDALQEAMDTSEQDADVGALGLTNNGFSLHHVGLSDAATLSRATSSTSTRSGSNGSSGSSSDFSDDGFWQAPSSGIGKGAAARTQQQQQQRAHHHVVAPRPGPSRLLAVTHGAACVRGRSKPDMQDHHLMVQDMLELATHASATPTRQQQQQGSARQQQELVVEEGDLEDVMAAMSTSGNAVAAGALQLHQSVRRHSTTYTASPSSGTSLLCAQAAAAAAGGGAGGNGWHSSSGNGNGSSNGHRHAGQQRHGVAAVVAAHPLCSSSLTGVFDGHCGSRTSRYAARRMPVLLAHSQQLWAALEGAAHPEGLSSTALSLAAGALHEAYARLDREILDEDRHKPPGEFDGTTALLGLQVGAHLLLANLGDSRAVLCRGGEALRLTTDHTPELPEERKRIEACGGYVREHRGVWRLVLPLGPGCGLKICAVSRALGDIDYKEPRPLLSAVPDVFHCALQPHTDRFAIFATDGVWGVVSDQQAVSCVDTALKQAARAGLPRPQCAEFAANQLRAFALERGSGDDITVVITVFEWESVAVQAGGGGDGSVGEDEMISDTLSSV